MKKWNWFELTLILSLLLFRVPYTSAQPSSSVVLTTKGDFILGCLPGASNFYVKEFTLSENTMAEMKAQGNFSPDATQLTFFYGNDSTGNLLGTVIFDSVTTAYGPIEVGICFSPDGNVSRVEVTSATVESEPWIKTDIEAGLMKIFVGMSSAKMADPLSGFSSDSVGEKPYMMAQVISGAVSRAIVYYQKLFLPFIQG